MMTRSGEGDRILHILSSKWTASPAAVMRLVEISVKAMRGAYKVSFSVTNVFSLPLGSSMLTSPLPMALRVDPSAVCTSCGSMGW